MKVSPVLVVLASLFSYISCWGLVGHEVTGAIADAHLSVNGKALVKSILDNYVAPDGKKFESLKTLAPYADNLRSIYDWAKNFHFINIPDDNEQFQPTRDCIKSVCLYGAINNYTQILRTAKSNDFDSLGQALMFVSHLVGDLHQPMHVSRKRDLGGNLIKLTLSDEWGSKFPSTNLHKVWDGELLYRWQKVDGLKTPTDIANKIIPTIDAVQKKNFLHTLGVDIIADESWDIAKEFGYALADDLDANDFPLSYYDDTIAVVKDRLIIGGLRLAGFINDIAEARMKTAIVDENLSDTAVTHCIYGCVSSDFKNADICAKQCKLTL